MSPPKLTRTGSLMDPQGVRPAGTNTAGTEPQRMGARRRLEFGQSPGANSSTAGEGNNSKKKKQLPTVSEVAELASKQIPAFDPLQIPLRSKRKTPIQITGFTNPLSPVVNPPLNHSESKRPLSNKQKPLPQQSKKS